MKTLRDTAVGETVTVVKLHGEGPVRKVAPLGDPIEVNVRGYELSLRKFDAGQIEVTG